MNRVVVEFDFSVEEENLLWKTCIRDDGFLVDGNSNCKLLLNLLKNEQHTADRVAAIFRSKLPEIAYEVSLRKNNEGYFALGLKNRQGMDQYPRIRQVMEDILNQMWGRFDDQMINQAEDPLSFSFKNLQ